MLGEIMAKFKSKRETKMSGFFRKNIRAPKRENMLSFLSLTQI